MYYTRKDLKRALKYGSYGVPVAYAAPVAAAPLAAATSASMVATPAAIRLEYFNLTGLAEVPRILLTVGGKRFEDHRYPFYKKEGGGFITPEMDADWEKGIFPMGQVPVLQANGHRFPQSKAIERYIARKVHLIGDNEEQACLIDGVNELIAELKKDGPNPWDPKNADELASFFEGLSTKLQYIENYAQRAQGWTVGSRISHCDINLYHFVNVHLADPRHHASIKPKAASVFEKFPHIRRIVAQVAAHPAVAAWNAGTAARQAAGQPF